VKTPKLKDVIKKRTFSNPKHERFFYIGMVEGLHVMGEKVFQLKNESYMQG
jgi:hypothetical protein